MFQSSKLTVKGVCYCCTVVCGMDYGLLELLLLLVSPLLTVCLSGVVGIGAGTDHKSLLSLTVSLHYACSYN